MPPFHEEIIHKALASEIRKEILLSLSEKNKYLTELSDELKKKPQSIDFHVRLLEEIGLIKSQTISGKKYYQLSEPKIIDFIKKERMVPAEFRPKPPHEIVLDMWKDMKKELGEIKERLSAIEKRLK